jgi:hypothetical protein
MTSDPALCVKRRNLVIVRAGVNSLHPNWIVSPYQDRNFDLIVSYFDKGAFEKHCDQDGVTPLFKPGGKWDGIYATLEWVGDSIDCYEYIWLPDDDIDTDAATVNRLFDEMHRYGLAVGQPSLTADSYFTHFLFINCPGLALRFTNYVEIMVPCLSLPLLKAVRHHFCDTMSGFGLDYIWCRLKEAGRFRSGIIDSISVKHTRPVGKVLLGSMASKGISAKSEEARLNEYYGISERITPLSYAALMERGMKISGVRKTGIVMFALHLKSIVQISPKKRHYRFGRLIQLMRRQLTRRLVLENLVATKEL